MIQPEEPSRITRKLTPEILNSQTISIYNETDRLTRAAIWGPIGIEAVLAQLYPPSVSLFQDSMNVPKARKEAHAFKLILQEYGVQVEVMRDKLATMLVPTEDLTYQAVRDGLFQKADTIHAQYNGNGTGRRFRGNWYQGTIEQLLQDDVGLYGEQEALRLNKLLSLDLPLAPGNLIYSRDQQNTLLGRMFKANMAKPIRQPEVALYDQIYKTMGINAITLPEGETFEGGDAYIHNNTVYIGVGPRTTKGAAEFIFRTLYQELKEIGMQFAIVEDPNPQDRPEREQMDFMHLDTFSGPTGHKEIAVCEEEATRRMVSYLEMSPDGTVRTLATEDNFLEHLLKQKEEILGIPAHEQQSFGCNFLAIDENTLLLPLDSNPTTNERLRAAGKLLVFLGLQESTKAYGASHCMTGQLARVPQSQLYIPSLRAA